MRLDQQNAYFHLGMKGQMDMIWTGMRMEFGGTGALELWVNLQSRKESFLLRETSYRQFDLSFWCCGVKIVPTKIAAQQTWSWDEVVVLVFTSIELWKAAKAAAAMSSGTSVAVLVTCWSKTSS
jgi:hypothetical protein